MREQHRRVFMVCFKRYPEKKYVYTLRVLLKKQNCTEKELDEALAYIYQNNKVPTEGLFKNVGIIEI